MESSFHRETGKGLAAAFVIQMKLLEMVGKAKFNITPA